MNIARKIKGWTGNHKKWTGVGAFLLIASTAALAAWLSTGSGAGRGAVGGNLQAITVTAGATPGSQLLPGTNSDGNFVVVNPTSAPMHIISAADGGGDRTIVSQGPDGGCTVQQLNSGVLVNALSNLNVPLPTGSSTVTVPNLWHGDPGLASQCAGVVFEKNVTLTATP